VEVERLRLLDGEPWAHTVTQFPRGVGEALLTADLTDVSLYGLLERHGQVRFERARRSIEAGVAPTVVATLLGIADGAPVLVMRSISYDDTGMPVERFTGHHRGDRSRLDIDVRRSNS
jgi:GntR family transcriptional regulator